MEEVLEEPTSIKIMKLYCEGQTEAEKDDWVSLPRVLLTNSLNCVLG